jgi:hypothetical protein
LSPSEKEQFKTFGLLDPKVRSNLVFRVSKKIKKALADLDELDEVLRILPEKTTRRLLDDDIVNSMLKLSEDSIKLLGYSPVKYDDSSSQTIVMRRSPLKSNTRTFKVTYEPATVHDISRMQSIRCHINTLNDIMSMEGGFPL